MLYVYASPVKAGKMRDYQKWLRSNIATIEKCWTKGWKLRGVYYSVFGLGEHQTEIHWEIEGYGSLELAAQQADEPYVGLIEEWFDYLDVRFGKGRLMKEAAAADTCVRAA